MKIEVNLPENSYENISEHDIKVVLASALYDKNIVALGYAAESVGLTKRILMDEMGKYDVNYYKYTENDVKRSIQNAKNLQI